MENREWGKGDERIKGEKRYKRRQTERQKENLVRSIDGQIKSTKDWKPTAPNKSFIFPTTPPGPGGTCFPGMPVTLKAALVPLPAISTMHSSKKSRSCTAVKASEGSLDADARCDLACGVVMMGRSGGLEGGLVCVVCGEKGKRGAGFEMGRVELSEDGEMRLVGGIFDFQENEGR